MPGIYGLRQSERPHLADSASGAFGQLGLAWPWLAREILSFPRPLLLGAVVMWMDATRDRPQFPGHKRMMPLALDAVLTLMTDARAKFCLFVYSHVV